MEARLIALGRSGTTSDAWTKFTTERRRVVDIGLEPAGVIGEGGSGATAFRGEADCFGGATAAGGLLQAAPIEDSDETWN